MMEKYDIEKLRCLPIEGVAQRLGLRVERHKCLCPFHDDHHASLSFHIGRNTFRCFVCDAKGGTIDLVMQYLKKDFKEACRWLADEHNIIHADESSKFQVSGFKSEPKPFDATRYERYFERPWLSSEAQKFLFEERRLDPRVVRLCRLTSWRDRNGVPWLQIPYYNREGQLVGVQNRNLVSSFKIQDSSYLKPGTWNLKPEAGTPRFRFPQGSQCGIYNLPVLNLLKPGDELYITEGCSDCWAMLSAGHKAIAIPSATLLSQKDKEILSSLSSPRATGAFRESTECAFGPTKGSESSFATEGKGREGVFSFHMYPDRDEPGERLFLQLQNVLPSLVHHQLPLGCKDFSEYYLKAPSGSPLRGVEG